MMKFYFLGIITLLGVCGYALNRYMEAKGLLWSAVAEVWPLWVLLVFIAFLVGRFFSGIVAQRALNSDAQTIRAQAEADKTNYRESVARSFDNREHQLALRIKALNTETQESERLRKKYQQEIRASWQDIRKSKAEIKQLIADTQVENEKHHKAAFNATKTVERIRKKHARDMAKLREESI